MKVLQLLLLVALVLCSTIQVQADWNSEISAASPLHWFTFDEDAGATTAIDQGSAGANGTYTAGKVSTAGLVGSAASFDGTSAVLVGGDDLVGDWTVEAIFSADVENGGASMGVLGADFTAADRLGLKAEQWNSTEQLGLTVFGVVDVTFADAAAATPIDLTHIAYVGTAGGIELFVDGVSVGSDPVTSSLSRHVLAAGAVRDDGSLVDGLYGAIDELVIFDRALSSTELAAHAASVPEPATAMTFLAGLLASLACRARRFGR